jgi:hypothetical protein
MTKANSLRDGALGLATVFGHPSRFIPWVFGAASALAGRAPRPGELSAQLRYDTGECDCRPDPSAARNRARQAGDEALASVWMRGL